MAIGRIQWHGAEDLNHEIVLCDVYSSDDTNKEGATYRLLSYEQPTLFPGIEDSPRRYVIRKHTMTQDVYSGSIAVFDRAQMLYTLLASGDLD